MYSSWILACYQILLGKKWIFKTCLLCKCSLSNQFLQIPYLPEGFEFSLHYEVILAELTAARIWALDPLVETGLVDKAQGARAATGCDERALFIPFTVTDPGEGHSSQDEISRRVFHTCAFPPRLIPDCIRNCNLRFRKRAHFTPTWSRTEARLSITVFRLLLTSYDEPLDTSTSKMHYHFIPTLTDFNSTTIEPYPQLNLFLAQCL